MFHFENVVLVSNSSDAIAAIFSPFGQRATEVSSMAWTNEEQFGRAHVRIHAQEFARTQRWVATKIPKLIEGFPS